MRRGRNWAAAGLFLLLALLVSWDYGRAYHKEENLWAWSAEHAVGPQNWTFHPPLGILTFTAANGVLGTGNLRIATILFFLAGAAIAYFLARDLFGEDAALLSLAVMAASYYSVTAAQTIDMDGGFVAFFSVAAAYAYNKYLSAKKNRFLLAAGLLLGIVSLYRISAGFVLLPAMLVLGLSKRNWIEAAKPVLVAAALMAACFGAWVAFDYAVYGGGAVRDALSHNGASLSAAVAAFPLAFLQDKASYGYLVQRYLTPAFVFLLALSAWHFLRKRSRQSDFLLAWLAAFTLVYFIPMGGDKARYVQAAVYPMAMLAGAYLSEMNLLNEARKTALTACACAVASYALLWSFNLNGWDAAGLAMSYGEIAKYTTAKYAIALLIPAGVFLARRDRKLALAALLGVLAGFSLYYNFGGGVEKQRSAAMDFASANIAHGPVLVLGDHAVCYHMFYRNVECTAVEPVSPTQAILVTVQRFYFPTPQMKDGSDPPQTMGLSEVPAYAKRLGATLVVVKKFYGVDAASECAEIAQLSQGNNDIAAVYDCA